MIWFYSGTNGSGKSLHVAKDIYNRLRRGGRKGNVIATFPVSMKKQKGKFTYCNIYDLTPKYLTDYAMKNHEFTGNPDKDEGQTLLVIDEAQRIFNPRDYDAKSRRGWLDWFPEHRKEGFNIIIISPFDKMIDKQIRALFEYEVVHRKVNNFGFIGGILSLLHIKWFWAIHYWYGAKQKMGVERFTSRRKYTSIYSSMKKADAVPEIGAAAPVGGPDSVTARTYDDEAAEIAMRELNVNVIIA
jgi:zona occludens toxin